MGARSWLLIKVTSGMDSAQATCAQCMLVVCFNAPPRNVHRQQPYMQKELEFKSMHTQLLINIKYQSVAIVFCSVYYHCKFMICVRV